MFNYTLNIPGSATASSLCTVHSNCYTLTMITLSISRKAVQRIFYDKFLHMPTMKTQRGV